MAKHIDLGKYGEELARNYLENKGYRILEKNWVYGRAEIDLIAFWEGQIIFVEVKTRRSAEHGEPEDFVDWKKEKQLEFASLEYIERKNHQGEIRFDIIAIVFENKELYTINHIEDAFWPT
ncbi:YraN family protein [Pedobacter sp. HMWF019]|uniref:YraN family protein n=1 Tax=Pedobacter sp. HMWF019 TaxID=2056856 RepID=UPI000D3B7950|nr:YraN family protein [Pedobacter sp. HMWF019]PTT01044.1 YraN family protein [Pedobacter sp. HMWF019]